MLKQIAMLLFVLALPGIVLASKKDQESAPPAFIETIAAKTTGYQNKVMITGTLVAIPGIVIRPEIPGRITKMYFKSGAMVAEGTI